MLVALHENQPLDALSAKNGPTYTCPNCGEDVILKQGRIRIHHFAHKRLSDCSWAKGETREHLLAKTVVRDAFRARSFQTEFEAEVLSGEGDRRADVLLTYASGARVAIEVQHTSIYYDAIERRTRAYIAAGVPVIWVGILSKEMRENAITVSSGLHIKQHVIRPWQKWARAYYFKNLWFIDPDEKTLWRGEFSDFQSEVPLASWYNEFGEEQTAGGYSRISKKWKTLELHGPTLLSDVEISFSSRKAWESKTFSLPKGRLANFK
jgi:competence protein CoiA